MAASPRGKATHVDGLAHRLTDGIGLTVAMQAMNMLDQLQSVEGLARWARIRLVPDPQDVHGAPVSRPTPRPMTCDMRTLEGRRGRLPS
jgi:glutamine synthetase